MKKIIAIFSCLLIVACAKDKIKEPPVQASTFLTADCPDTIKFETQIKPLITQWCMGCHSPGGSFPELSNHQNISFNADNMLKAMNADGVQLMPQGGPALQDSVIRVFSCWIKQGKLNN